MSLREDMVLGEFFLYLKPILKELTVGGSLLTAHLEPGCKEAG